MKAPRALHAAVCNERERNKKERRAAAILFSASRFRIKELSKGPAGFCAPSSSPSQTERPASPSRELLSPTFPPLSPLLFSFFPYPLFFFSLYPFSFLPLSFSLISSPPFLLLSSKSLFPS